MLNNARIRRVVLDHGLYEPTVLPNRGDHVVTTNHVAFVDPPPPLESTWQYPQDDFIPKKPKGPVKYVVLIDSQLTIDGDGYFRQEGILSLPQDATDVTATIKVTGPLRDDWFVAARYVTPEGAHCYLLAAEMELLHLEGGVAAGTAVIGGAGLLFEGAGVISFDSLMVEPTRTPSDPVGANLYVGTVGDPVTLLFQRESFTTKTWDPETEGYSGTSATETGVFSIEDGESLSELVKIGSVNSVHLLWWNLSRDDGQPIVPPGDSKVDLELQMRSRLWSVIPGSTPTVSMTTSEWGTSRLTFRTSRARVSYSDRPSENVGSELVEITSDYAGTSPDKLNSSYLKLTKTLDNGPYEDWVEQRAFRMSIWRPEAVTLTAIIVYLLQEKPLSPDNAPVVERLMWREQEVSGDTHYMTFTNDGNKLLQLEDLEGFFESSQGRHRFTVAEYGVEQGVTLEARVITKRVGGFPLSLGIHQNDNSN